MADALALGASVHDVGVQVPSSAPQKKQVQKVLAFFVVTNKSVLKGLERKRKENSSHLLFLAVDRSILQSIKIELWHVCFAKCKNSRPVTNFYNQTYCVCFLIYNF